MAAYQEFKVKIESFKDAGYTRRVK